MYPPSFPGYPFRIPPPISLSYCVCRAASSSLLSVGRSLARSSDNSFSTFLLFSVSVSVSPLCFRGNYWVWERAAKGRTRPETNERGSHRLFYRVKIEVVL